MDKTKFTERPGDSEGFTELQLANAHVDGLFVRHDRPWLTKAESEFVARHEQLHEVQAWAQANPQVNPKGWQEVDGVKLSPINWAERSDEELEAAFQEWQRR